MPDAFPYLPLLTALLLAYAAVAKLRSPVDFRRAVASWEVVRPARVRVVATTVPVFELLLSGTAVFATINPAFVGGGLRLGGGVAIIATAAVFCAGQFYLLKSRDSALCGCTASASRVSWFSIARAAVMGIFALPLLVGA